MTSYLWSPARSPVDSSYLVRRVAALTFAGIAPCNPRALAMLDDISQRILMDPVSRRAPQYVALAYWLRRAALTRLAAELTSSDRPGQIRTPRGVALHLPPTNVDTIFVYSWAMSVLAGNANIVRLPENMSVEADWLAKTISEAVSDHGESERHLFCYYPYGGEIEATLAGHCDLRVIWGGDEKVRAVSRHPIQPDGLSIGFPDRKSLAMIGTEIYRASDTSVRDALSEQFFNDLFWFEQMGCGSPRLLVWIGEPDGLAEDFYRRLQKVITKKSYTVETGVAIGKLALSHDLLAEGVASQHRRFGNELHVNRTTDPVSALKRPHGGGFLCDWVTPSVTDIADFVTRQIQTITHFGVDAHDVETLARSLISRGGYRVVPIGQALQFDTTWDGLDLYEHMTRKILVRVR
ncbi:MAG: hypothetical protein J0I80_13830 [Sphingomonas sp.]|nr:hypothetical protein [Sphingomonas sp.]